MAFWLLTLPVHAQSRQVRKKIRKAEKVEINQKREAEKDQKKKIKEHWNRQTKVTQERMKETDKRAEQFNKQTDKTLFNQLFNTKKRKAKKRHGRRR